MCDWCGMYVSWLGHGNMNKESTYVKDKQVILC